MRKFVMLAVGLAVAVGLWAIGTTIARAQGAVAVDAWAWGAAGLARSCGVTSLQGFDVIRDPSCAGLHPSAEVGVTL